MKQIKLDKEYVISNDENDLQADKYIFSCTTEYKDNYAYWLPDYAPGEGTIVFYKYMEYKNNSFILACLELPYVGSDEYKTYNERDGDWQSWEQFSKWNHLDDYFMLVENGESEKIELFDMNNNKLSAKKILDLTGSDVDCAFMNRNRIEELYVFDDFQNRIIRTRDMKVIALFDEDITYELCDDDIDVRAIDYYVKKYNIKESGIVKNIH